MRSIRPHIDELMDMVRKKGFTADATGTIMNRHGLSPERQTDVVSSDMGESA